MGVSIEIENMFKHVFSLVGVNIERENMFKHVFVSKYLVMASNTSVGYWYFFRAFLKAPMAYSTLIFLADIDEFDRFLFVAFFC